MQPMPAETETKPSALMTPEEKEAAVYAMAASGTISRRTADNLVFYMARGRQMAAELGSTTGAIAEQLKAQQMAEIYDQARLDAVKKSLTEARIPPHLHGANFETDEDGAALQITTGNQRAHGLCQRLANEWTPRHKGLTLYGASGRGKTYLALAVLVSLIKQHGAAINARYVSERDLLNYFRESYRKRPDDLYTPSTVTVREWFAVRPQFLLLDDLGSETPSSGEKGDWARGQIMDLVEYRTSRKLTTLVTTNLADTELVKMYDDRIASRIYGHSPMITITGADWRQKVRPDAEDPFWDAKTDPSTGRPWVRG